MKRTLSSSVLRKKAPETDQVTEEDHKTEVKDNTSETESTVATGLKPRLGGSGSAWKAGALSDASQLLSAERAQIAERIMTGRHELEIDTKQIVDVIGTDRREDWRDQEAFEKLKASIEKNGQDTPIHVWPIDPEWRPDQREPENIEGVQFSLMIGRRRHAILSDLGRPVRAILASQEKRGSQEEQFEMLFMRFRENDDREDLSAFERLVSIGEMFEELREASPNEKISASDFAERVGVHNSAVSRGRAVFAHKNEILHACKNIYSLSHRELEKVLNDLSDRPSKQTKKRTSKPKKLTVERKIGMRKLSLVEHGGKLSVSAAGLKVDQETLEGLADLITKYLSEKGAAK